MKWFLILATALSFAFADSSHHSDSSRFPMDLHDLKLTPQQHKAVENAMKEYQHSYRRYRRQDNTLQEELNTIFLNPRFDQALYQSKSVEAERTAIEIRTQLFSRLHAILTPEQRERFIHHLQEWEIE
ncbi:periplasmic heavy metal sensor [Sulfuricurvum sp.]|uniref:Spy/CpxP family protein refolding chaperone n=1 Tax=Sulfuricurvum sp. TaxID=2025608 RepID=UPI002630C6C1|nr:periplasmic heavy metal sensor [Sulfuricurvum sp.]MDD3596223.1 periplasmic heavy metal sensor [Sulfuricurvum sp.]